MMERPVVERRAAALIDHTTAIQAENVHAWFDRLHALRGITMTIPERKVTAVIGPSGCGKSTFLRCLNRMHELVPGARVSGAVLMDGRQVIPYLWETNTLWFDASRYYANFVIIDLAANGLSLSAEQAFGKPVRIGHLARWEILIYQKNLLKQLAAAGTGR